MSTTDFSIADALSILKRRWKTFAIVFAAITTIGVVLILDRVDQFRSDAKLFVKVGRESVTLDPTVSTGETLGLRASRETEINSAVEILKSRPVFEKVVDRIGVDKILDSSVAPSMLTKMKSSLGSLKTLVRPPKQVSAEEQEASRREAAVSKIANSLSISHSEMSAVINVSGTAERPSLAQKIVAAVLESFAKHHVHLNRTVGSEQFFDDQASLLHSRLSDARKRLRDLKNQNGIASIEAQFRLLESKKSEISATKMRNAPLLHAANAKRSTFESLLQKSQEFIKSGSVEGLADAAGDGMRQQLYGLEIKANELTARYNASHPKVLAIRKQVADVRKILQGQDQQVTNSTYSINPVWQQLKIDIIMVESEIAGLVAANQSLDQQYAEVIDEMTKLNTLSLTHQDLSNQVALLEESYKTHSASLEQARLNSAMEAMQITNVNVAQHPTFAQKPVGPGTAMLGAVGLIVALVGGAFSAVLKDCLDVSIRTPDDLASNTNLPVLMSIPRSPRNQIKI